MECACRGPRNRRRIDRHHLERADLRRARRRGRPRNRPPFELSSAGKSTIATELERELFNLGRQVYVLDGDRVRHGLCSDLAFSPEDR
ncbi:MAG: adenylyl-sulfate kinase, partial [Verrucomicrobiota bacterium]